jgi:hypothetical protein
MSGLSSAPLVDQLTEICAAGYGNEILFEERKDYVRSAKPLLISRALVVDHDRERVQLRGDAPNERDAAQPVDEAQEWREPRLNDDKAPPWRKDPSDLEQSLLQIAGKFLQMMQSALYHDNVLGAGFKGQVPTIRYIAFAGAVVLGKKGGGKVCAFDVCETQIAQRAKAISATAEQLDNFRVARPLVRPQALQSLHKFAGFLFRCFEAKISCLPIISAADFRFVDFNQFAVGVGSFQGKKKPSVPCRVAVGSSRRKCFSMIPVIRR